MTHHASVLVGCVHHANSILRASQPQLTSTQHTASTLPALPDALMWLLFHVCAIAAVGDRDKIRLHTVEYESPDSSGVCVSVEGQKGSAWRQRDQLVEESLSATDCSREGAVRHPAPSTGRKSVVHRQLAHVERAPAAACSGPQ